MEELLRQIVGERTAVVRVTDRLDGDFHPKRVDQKVLRLRQAAIAGPPWTMLDQVHGVRTHVACSQPDAGYECFSGATVAGDILITSELDTPLAIWAADCAPLAMFGSYGTTVALHAGWRGLASGVVDAGLAELYSRNEAVECALLGPAIHACCYEFGETELEMVASGVGVPTYAVSGQTTDGKLALDVAAAVREALARHNVRLDVSAGCTGCDGRWFSHRVRRDAERHAVVAWTENPTMG